MAKYGGIDLGTTYTSISYYDENSADVKTIDLVESADGLKTLRSVIYYPGSGEPPVVGSSAWNAYRQFPDRVVVGIKRSMGTSFTLTMDGIDLTPQVISAEILKTVVRDAEGFLGEELKDVVITVPAYFGDAERAATEEAGKLAGLNVLRLLPEPHAAALAYSIEKVANIVDRHLLVYDLGGGTFDVTLIHATTASDDAASPNQTNLKIETLCKDGNAALGGLDWDRLLSQLVADKVLAQFGVDIMLDPKNEPILLDNCEKAKRDLSRISQVAIVADMLGHQVTVSRSEFENATSDLLMQTEALLEQVLADAESQHGLTKNDIDVMLTGGSSKMPMVKQMIERVMGKPPFTHKNPELLVTMGAAYWAYLLQEGATVTVTDPQDPANKTDVVVKQNGLTDTARYAIGVEVIRSDGQGGYKRFNSVVVPAGATYGQEFVKEFRTAEDDMTEIVVALYKGDAAELDQCEYLAEAVISGLPPDRPRGQFVKVTLSYDNSGILRGSAVDKATGLQCELVVDHSKL